MRRCRNVSQPAQAHLRTALAFHKTHPAPLSRNQSPHVEAIALREFPRANQSHSESFVGAQEDELSLLVSSGLTLPICMGIQSLVDGAHNVLGSANVQEVSLALMCLIAPQLINTAKHVKAEGGSLRLVEPSKEELEQIDVAFTPLLMHNTIWLHAIYGSMAAPYLGIPFVVELLARLGNKKVNIILKEVVPTLCGIGLFAQLLAQYQLFQDVPGSGPMLVASMYAQAAAVPLLLYDGDDSGAMDIHHHRGKQIAAQALLSIALVAQLQILGHI